jgi:hypothetical protein
MRATLSLARENKIQFGAIAIYFEVYVPTVLASSL